MRLLALVAFLSLTACTYIDIRPVGSIAHAKPSQETAEFLLSQVEKCWTRELSTGVFGGFGPDAIHRRVTGSDGVITITVGRDNSDIPFQPFFVMSISAVGTNDTSIELQEGSYAFNIYMDFEQDVRRWLAGDLACSELKAGISRGYAPYVASK